MLGRAAAGSLGLAGLAGLTGLTGCKGITALGPVPGIAPDVVTLEHAIEAEEAMVATYRAALATLAGLDGNGGGNGRRLAAVIAAVHSDHQAHLTQLRARLILPPRLARIRLRPAKPVPQLPADRHGLVEMLAAAERAAAARLTSELIDAPPALAQLMASISASEAGHMVSLRRTSPA